MNSSEFQSALSAGVQPNVIASKGGLSYIAAATAVGLAGRPEISFVEFSGQPHLKALKGALVAVDLPIGTEGVKQRTWLPVMDRDNKALDIELISAVEVNNSRQRCLAKAIASVYGHGMSLYLGCEGDGAKAMKLLGVDADTDLATANPIVATLAEGGAPYIEWHVGLAVARITDPTFHWEVKEWDGYPFREVLGGLQVDVTTVYRGRSLTLSLPIMDAAFKPIPADAASTYDWNKAVMRALTKCIAFNTGYGLGVYADEFGTSDKKAAEKGTSASAGNARKPRSTPATKTAEAAAGSDANAKQPVASETGTTGGAGDGDKTPPTEPASEAEAENVEPAVVTRFKGVMSTRLEKGGVAALVTLVNALKISDKYEEADKPICYDTLIQGSTALMDVANVLPFITELAQHGGMQHVAGDARPVIAARLISLAIASAISADNNDVLMSVPDLIFKAGIAKDLHELMALASGETPIESLELLTSLLETA